MGRLTLLSGLKYSGSSELINPNCRGFLQSQAVISNACNFEIKKESSTVIVDKGRTSWLKEITVVLQ